MSFMIQYSCPQCGYHSRVDSTGFSALIDPWNMPELYICTCNHCHDLFQRRLAGGKAVNRCTECDSEDITIHAQMQEVPCPVCGEKHQQIECIGSCF